MSLPDASVPGFEKKSVPVAPSAPARPQGAVPASTRSAEPDDEGATRPKDASPWTIAFAVLSAALLLLVGVFWNKVADRDRTIQGNKNRAEQVEAGAAVMQAQLEEAKAVSARLQIQLDETKKDVFHLKSAQDKAKAGAEVLQAQLDKARAVSTGFQTQMEEAKVASLKRLGEVAVAQAQTTVAQTESGKAKADLVQLQAQWAEAKALAADLQARLAKTESEVAQLKRTPVRK